VYFERAPGDSSAPGTCAGHDVDHAAIDYSSGILIVYELVAGTGFALDADPEGQYQQEAQSWPAWTTTTINGSPGLLIPQDSTGPAAVDFTDSGIEISVYAQYAPLDLQSLVKALLHWQPASASGRLAQ
jgi:hypothetical protein